MISDNIYISNPKVYDTWIALVNYIYENGVEVKDERGDLTLECLDVMSAFSSPFAKLGDDYILQENKGSLWRGNKIQAYVDQFNSPENDGFVYTYGSRLRNAETPRVSGYSLTNSTSSSDVYDQVHLNKINQVDKIVNKLKKSSKSRRATCVTWNPYLDNINEEVPCLIMVDYKIRNGKLHTFAVWRSHDIFQAYYPNMIGLSHMTKEILESYNKYVDKKSDMLEFGDFRIRSISAHIRLSDIDSIKRVIK